MQAKSIYNHLQELPYTEKKKLFNELEKMLQQERKAIYAAKAMKG
jgi:hypothetical protein